MARNMGVVDISRIDDAVYWHPGPIDKHGQKTFLSPIDIKVRWDDRNEVFIDKAGNQATAKSVVFVGELVGEDGNPLLPAGSGTEVSEFGVLRRGTVAGLASAANPFANKNPPAYEVRSFSKTHGLRATQAVRKVYL